MKKRQAASTRKTNNYDCTECNLFEAKVVIWDDEASKLVKIQHEIKGLMPTYGSEHKLVKQVVLCCDTLLEYRFEVLNAYLDYCQDREFGNQPCLLNHSSKEIRA